MDNANQTLIECVHAEQLSNIRRFLEWNEVDDSDFSHATQEKGRVALCRGTTQHVRL